MNALSSRLLLQIVCALDKREDLDTTRLLRDVGLSLETLEAPDAWTSAETVDAMWKRAVVLTGDDNFGLTAAAYLEPRHLGAFGYVVASSANVGQAVQRLMRFKRLTGDVSTVELQLQGDTARYIHRTALPPLSLNRQNSEWGLSALVNFLRSITGQADWRPLEVTFAHPAPPDTRLHEELFGCPVRFRAKEDSMLFEQRFMASPFLGTENVLSEILEAHATKLLAELPAERDFVATMQKALQKELPGGTPTLECLSEALGLSARSMQRRLEERGLTFQQVLDDMRERLAAAYLEQRSTSVAEVAFLLGYSDSSTFSRAFRRWHKVSPTEWRNAR